MQIKAFRENGNLQIPGKSKKDAWNFSFKCI